MVSLLQSATTTILVWHHEPESGDGHCMSYNPALLPPLLKGIRMCEETAGGDNTHEKG